jgi:hypothetical protein
MGRFRGYPQFVWNLEKDLLWRSLSGADFSGELTGLIL